MKLFLFELKKSKKSIITWSIILIAILLLYISFYPSFSDSGFSELIEAKMDLLPDAFLKAFNLDVVPNFSILIEYFAYVFQFIMMALCIYATVTGISMLSKEESEGTIEYLYANPVTRREIVTSKILASISSLFIIMMSIFIFSLLFGAIFSGFGMFNDLVKLMGYSYYILLIYLSIGFVLSVIMKRVGTSSMVALGVFFGTYIIGVMSGIIEKLDFLKYVSPFNYAMPTDIIKNNVNNLGLIIGAGIIVISIVLTYKLYEKRDMII